MAEDTTGGTTSEVDLIHSAAVLSRVATGEWETFLKALERRTREAAEVMIISDIASLQINQGRAQAYRKLLQTCANCRELLNDIHTQQAKKFRQETR